jgi:hypothetical protein
MSHMVCGVTRYSLARELPVYPLLSFDRIAFTDRVVNLAAGLFSPVRGCFFIISRIFSACVPKNKWFVFMHAGLSHVWQTSNVDSISNPIKSAADTLCANKSLWCMPIVPYPVLIFAPVQHKHPLRLLLTALRMISSFNCRILNALRRVLFLDKLITFRIPTNSVRHLHYQCNALHYSFHWAWFREFCIQLNIAMILIVIVVLIVSSPLYGQSSILGTGIIGQYSPFRESLCRRTGDSTKRIPQGSWCPATTICGSCEFSP